MSKYQDDLHQEAILSTRLDDIYQSKGFRVTRIKDLSRQHQGIDIEISHNNQTYMIDEKSQLHYLNKDLPTFTFELSYLKHNQLKQGWLFDKKKLNQYYFLVTGIMLKSNQSTLTHKSDIQQLKITSVNRKKLIAHLNQLGLTEERLNQYTNDCRQYKHYGKQIIAELDPKYQGLLYHTQHLSEQPINLQLKLKYLIAQGVAKRIYE